MAPAALFGTDGVRGKAGESPLDPATSAGSARRSCVRSPSRPDRARFLIGRDTRESGDWIERELAPAPGCQAPPSSSAGVDPDARRGLPHARERVTRAS